MSASVAVSPVAAVCEVLDNLIKIGGEFDGLWPSIIEFDSRKSPTALPPAIEGQRDCDRALRGSNLMHDMAAVGLLYELAGALNRPDYKEAADRYMKTFCARAVTASGLFPWGEHSFIDLDTGGVGDCYLYAVYDNVQTEWWDGLPRPAWHDHLRQAPVWFWDKLEEFSPGLVQRFADGLDRHWLTDERLYFMRHAGINRAMRHGYREGNRTCDFPRHSGHYLLDLACAYVQEPRPETMEQIWRYADHWWNRYVPGETLPLESSIVLDTKRPDHEERTPIQTLSLAVSLLDSAEVLKGTDDACAAELEKRAKAYLEEFLAAPHDPEAGVVVVSYNRIDRTVVERQPLYGSIYGLNAATAPALMCCRVYRLTGDKRFLDFAIAIGRGSLKAALEEKNPGEPITHTDRVCTPTNAPAMDPGLALELYADLHDLTGDVEWLDAGATLWPVAYERYFHKGLIRLASGIDWYEAQGGAAYLLHGAARFGLLERGIKLKPDYSAR